MDTTILRKAGLTESQAKGYLALIEHGALTPAQLAEHTGENRTNAYAVTDKLVALGLANKKDTRPAKYIANHPSVLEDIAERRREIVIKNEQIISNSIGSLIDLFYASTEMPSTKNYQGTDGIKQVYTETLKSTTDIYLVRTVADTIDLGEEYLNDYRAARAKLGVHTYALTPDTEVGRRHATSGEDEKMLFHRTIIPASYTAPIEIDVYGDKIAFIAFGETQIATIITSPPIAEAMRQLLRLLGEQLSSNVAS